MQYRHHRNGSIGMAIFREGCSAFLVSRLGSA